MPRMSRIAVVPLVVFLYPLTDARAQEEAPPTPSTTDAQAEEPVQQEQSPATQESQAEATPQATPPSETAPQTPPKLPAGSDVEEITVTGSRIKRSGLTTPTPTTVIDTKMLLESGELNVADVLNELPSIASGIAMQNSTQSFGNAGLSHLDLRDLGTRRTLILLNGRRAVATPDQDNNLAFDLSNLPPGLIERIEVITGGASAVYGADAVAGVINIITHKSFEGAKFDLQTGISREGDGAQINFNALGGANFAEERGNVVFAFNYAKSNEIMRTDRDNLMVGIAYVRNPANEGPDDGRPDYIVRKGLRWYDYGLNSPALWLPVNENLARNDDMDTRVTFDEQGNLRLFDMGEEGLIDGVYTSGGEGVVPFSTSPRSLLQGITRLNFYGRASYNLFGSVKAVLEGTVARTTSGRIFEPAFAGYGNNRIQMDNPYIKDDLRAIMVGDPGTPDDDIKWITLDRDMREYGTRNLDVDRDFLSISAGLEGVLPNGWDWQAYYQTGGATVTYKNYNEQLDARFRQALDAVRDPETNEIVCRDPSNGCVPINLLGPEGFVSPEARDWIVTDHVSLLFSRQHLASGFLRGDIIELPAGDLAFAAGLEYRREAIRSEPSYVRQEALGFYGSMYSAVDESYDVKEGFLEISVPLVRDVFLLESLNVEAAARLASYDLAGENLSWKLGGDWAPITDLRLRAVYAKAARAPSMGELFNPGSRGSVGLDDPCDELELDKNPNRRQNCAALGIPDDFVSTSRLITTNVFRTGNKNLKVEDGYTLTLGGVFVPRFVPGLSVTVDYWRINLTNGINSFGAQTTLNNCVDSPTIDNPFCPMVLRGPDHNIIEVRDTFVNVSEFIVRGFDFEVGYALPLGDLGDLGFRVLGTRLLQLDFAEAPEKGGVQEYAGEYGDPLWRGSFDTRYSNGPFSINVQLRYVGTQKVDLDVKPEVYEMYEIPSTVYTDLQARFAFDSPLIGKRVSLFAGVNNLFNTTPPVHPYTYSGALTYYDVMGMFFYGGLTASL